MRLHRRGDGGRRRHSRLISHCTWRAAVTARGDTVLSAHTEQLWAPLHAAQLCRAAAQTQSSAGITLCTDTKKQESRWLKRSAEAVGALAQHTASTPRRILSSSLGLSGAAYGTQRAERDRTKPGHPDPAHRHPSTAIRLSAAQSPSPQRLKQGESRQTFRNRTYQGSWARSKNELKSTETKHSEMRAAEKRSRLRGTSPGAEPRAGQGALTRRVSTGSAQAPLKSLPIENNSDISARTERAESREATPGAVAGCGRCGQSRAGSGRRLPRVKKGSSVLSRSSCTATRPGSSLRTKSSRRESAAAGGGAPLQLMSFSRSTGSVDTVTVFTRHGPGGSRDAAAAATAAAPGPPPSSTASTSSAGGTGGSGAGDAERRRGGAAMPGRARENRGEATRGEAGRRERRRAH